MMTVRFAVLHESDPSRIVRTGVCHAGDMQHQAHNPGERVISVAHHVHSGRYRIDHSGARPMAIHHAPNESEPVQEPSPCLTVDEIHAAVADMRKRIEDRANAAKDEKRRAGEEARARSEREIAEADERERTILAAQAVVQAAIAGRGAPGPRPWLRKAAKP